MNYVCLKARFYFLFKIKEFSNEFVYKKLKLKKFTN